MQCKMNALPSPSPSPCLKNAFMCKQGSECGLRFLLSLCVVSSPSLCQLKYASHLPVPEFCQRAASVASSLGLVRESRKQQGPHTHTQTERYSDMTGNPSHSREGERGKNRQTIITELFCFQGGLLGDYLNA